MMKKLKNKTLSFLNQKLDDGLVQALSLFIKEGIKQGAALDKL